MTPGTMADAPARLLDGFAQDGGRVVEGDRLAAVLQQFQFLRSIAVKESGLCVLCARASARDKTSRVLLGRTSPDGTARAARGPRRGRSTEALLASASGPPPSRNRATRCSPSDCRGGWPAPVRRVPGGWIHFCNSVSGRRGGGDMANFRGASELNPVPEEVHNQLPSGSLGIQSPHVKQENRTVRLKTYQHK